MNMKLVREPLRNSFEALSTQNLIILRNFQYWPKVFVSYKKIHVNGDSKTLLVSFVQFIFETANLHYLKWSCILILLQNPALLLNTQCVNSQYVTCHFIF